MFTHYYFFTICSAGLKKVNNIVIPFHHNVSIILFLPRTVLVLILFAFSLTGMCRGSVPLYLVTESIQSTTSFKINDNGK